MLLLLSRLWVLDARGYDALRNAGSPVTTAIEEHAMNLLSERLRMVGDRIAGLAYGHTEAEMTPGATFFGKVALALGSPTAMQPWAQCTVT